MQALSKFRGPPEQAPRTLSNQQALPRLPIPPLQQTVDKYLKSLEPLFLQAEELGELPPGSDARSELAKRQQFARKFLDSQIASVLQSRLVDVDATTPSNWLDDRYWLQKAYHEWRVPLLINSNWWLMFAPDPQIQSPADTSHPGNPSPLHSLSQAEWAQLAKDTSKPIDVASLLGPTNWTSLSLAIRRAAWLTWRLVEFKTRLDKQNILPDTSRAGPFCMHQYTNLFGVTRIPALPHDWNTRPAGPVVPQAQANKSDPVAYHITVIIRNNYYDLQVIDPQTGFILSPSAIEDGLKALISDAETRPDGPGVGVLSSQDRDTWAVEREHLLSVSPQNVESVQSIQTSLFALAVDTSVLPLPGSHEAPVAASPTWVDAQARNGSGAGRGGHNRWFDKSITLIVEPNGRASLMGEHSPVDALIPAIICDYASAVPATPFGQAFPTVDTTASSEISSARSAFKRRDFDVDAKLSDEIATATRSAVALAAESDIRELFFDEYGTDWIKKVAKVSPDAYLQTVLQIAMTLTYGKQTPTYETASTRFFRKGRTDVIRSFSTESYQFVSALVRGKEKDPQKLYALLAKACQAHSAQTKASSFGGGIDRHLTGLRLVYDASRDGPLPELLADEALGKSQSWILSTSGLNSGDLLSGTGFGAGFPDGFGCNYLPGNKVMKFGLESKKSHSSTTKFAHNIVEALHLLRDVVEKGGPARPPPKL